MGIRINNTTQVGWFEYFYLFMIVLYAGQSNGLDSLVFAHEISFVFVLPILMTIILLMRHHVNFEDKNFLFVLLILTIWFIIQNIYRNGQINLTLTLFHYYQLILCFIIVQVFREKLFSIYESILYKLAILSLILWVISVIVPNLMANLFRLFGNGTTISEGSAFVYTMMRLDMIRGVLIRNAGFAWEPGRYSCFLCLAIFCNFLINGYTIKKNIHLWIFVLALFTTQSTTGAFTLIVLMILFVFNKQVHYRFSWIIFMIPMVYFLFNSDFGSKKLQRSIERSENTMEISNVAGQKGYSLDRIESLVVEWNNFLHDPVMGYCEQRHSYFEKEVAHGFFFNNGTMHILAAYGILGFLYYICIYMSSRRMAQCFDDKVPFSFLLLFISISMSYNFHNIVLIMAFSFWGLFVPQSVWKNIIVKNKFFI